MANTREIRRRIKSIKNIQQITKAMKVVSATRFRRIQEKINSSQFYKDGITNIFENIITNNKDIEHKLQEVRVIKRVGFLVLCSDKGMAGAYISNLLKEAMLKIQKYTNIGIFTVGSKVRDYFKKKSYAIDVEYTGFSEKPTYENAILITKDLIESFICGKNDEIYVVYTKFHSSLCHTPITIKLLPLEKFVKLKNNREYIIEPTSKKLLKYLIPKYLEILIYDALLQSAASELGARMTAMSSATDNAEKLINKFVLNYNKMRQAIITSEISEIVGGAEALN